MADEKPVRQAQDKALALRGKMSVVVVTPKREVTRRDVDEITAFGALGEFGVLPGHVPYLTMLQAGVLILRAGSDSQVWAHGPGFLEVGNGGQVEILVDMVAEASEVDPSAVTAELQTVEGELEDLDSAVGAEWKTLATRRDWAMAKLEAQARG